MYGSKNHRLNGGTKLNEIYLYAGNYKEIFSDITKSYNSDIDPEEILKIIDTAFKNFKRETKIDIENINDLLDMKEQIIDILLKHYLICLINCKEYKINEIDNIIDDIAEKIK